ncbi:hypothetical protein [Laspinema sp. D2d]|nr:hypothetical protein [Laspinema sp. D2d]
MVRALRWKFDEIRWGIPIGVLETEFLRWRSREFDSLPSLIFSP